MKENRRQYDFSATQRAVRADKESFARIRSSWTLIDGRKQGARHKAFHARPNFCKSPSFTDPQGYAEQSENSDLAPAEALARKKRQTWTQVCLSDRRLAGDMISEGNEQTFFQSRRSSFQRCRPCGPPLP
jgi:hypothetical protein